MSPTDAAKNRYADAIPPTMPTSGPMAWTPWSVEEFSAKLSASHPHYRILNLISHGGMGAVYQATDTQKGHALAIKVMRPDLLAEGDFVERFQREIKMLRELDHPHIVRLVDRGLTADGVPFLVMPYLEGRSLAEVIQDKERLTLPRILALMQQLCSGTTALHDKGIIHRDLKPANIFLRAPDDHAIILDLGIARPQMPLDGLHTQTGVTLGTESYMAPEVKAGKKAEKTADIYALGIILYQLLTQRFPEGKYQLASDWVKDPRIDEIVANAIHADPRERYKSVTEFADALNAIQTPATSSTPISDDEYSTPNPASISIELNETQLTVNGYDFSLATTIEEWMQVFGRYSVMNASSSWGTPSSYYWYELGIRADFNHQGFVALLIASKNSGNEVFAHQRLAFKNAPLKLNNFQGNLKVNGILIGENFTSQDLVNQMSHSKNLWFWEKPFHVKEPIQGKIFSIEAGHKLEVEGAMMLGSNYLSADEAGAHFGAWSLEFDFILHSALDAYDFERAYLLAKPDNFSRNERNSFFSLAASSSPVSIVHIRRRHEISYCHFIKPTVLRLLDHQDTGRPLLRIGQFHEGLPFLQLHEKSLVYVDNKGEPTVYPFETNPSLRCNFEFKLSNILKNRLPYSWRIMVEGRDGHRNFKEFTLCEFQYSYSSFLGSRCPTIISYTPSDGVGFIHIKNETALDQLRASPWFSLFSELAYFCYWTKKVQADRAIKFPKYTGQSSATQSRFQLLLHPCPTCRKEIAKSARTCPHCGENLRSGQKPRGWRQKACSNCGEVMSRFAQKCQQPDCGHPNTLLKVQSTVATLAVLAAGFWCWQHYTQQQTQGLLLPIAATVIALIWRGSLSLLKSFYSY